ncbi:hypothetical protein KOEU_33610 [Komagataeibacter europaeus]|uniref:Uncharacterized protein n=1 Tax=Komagataeibacter europaeus TaxID=33995 RepID=A0A0M0ECX0_KOMEU|nr:hypothetical protein KOEU_33610 [Komagataeibacter europaeus]
MPSISRVRKRETVPVFLKVAIARRSWSASDAENPAHTMATCITCS